MISILHLITLLPPLLIEVYSPVSLIAKPGSAAHGQRENSICAVDLDRNLKPGGRRGRLNLQEYPKSIDVV